MKKFYVLFAIVCAIAIIESCRQNSSNTGKKEAPETADAKKVSSDYYSFDEKNNLIRPKNYREWVFVGSGSTPQRLNKDVIFPDFQIVYIDPASFQYWKEHGEYPEGAIFVKELLYEHDTISPIGKGSYMGNSYYSLAAMVKDSKRFPNQLGGWEYFLFENAQTKRMNEKAVATSATCQNCHNQNAPNKINFDNYYPILVAAKGVGKESPENSDYRSGLEKGRAANLDAKN